MSNCNAAIDGWVSYSRQAPSNATCTSSFCQTGFNDSSWRKVRLTSHYF
jgi:hypothetical protein